jgi:NADH:ubiquinone oxidoreductase subunit 6 (subunit J)
VYDVRIRQPFLAIVSGGVLLAVLVYAIDEPPPAASVDQSPTAATASAPTNEDADTLSTLGRSLFVDHLISVELAGLLLLVAVFGTVLVAIQSREQAR